MLVVKWLIDLANELTLPKKSVFNAVSYLDKVTTLCDSINYQFYGLVCLVIASKLEESNHPPL